MHCLVLAVVSGSNMALEDAIKTLSIIPGGVGFPAKLLWLEYNSAAWQTVFDRFFDGLAH